jgi:tRNA(Ile)-lysidine synthase
MTAAFTVSRLDETLTRLALDAQSTRYCVAFSGGVDSAVLLHATAMLRERYPGLAVRAVHVNHHLQTHAVDWARHSRDFAAGLGVVCDVLDVHVVVPRGESTEAAARAARYSALSQALGEGEFLLTAHHRDDQLETLLLHLLRGAGVAGLDGVPESASLGRGRLLRPLLDVDHSELVAYAQAAGLKWVEDPSNADTRFDRNYLRQRVLPVLLERWPAAASGASRTARHLVEAQALLEERAREDLALARAGANLRVSAVRALDPPRARNLLRFWIARAGFRVPSSAVLDQVLWQMLNARDDALPLIKWGEVELRRYRDALYLGRSACCTPLAALTWDWRARAELELPAELGRLRMRPARHGEAAFAAPLQPLRVDWQRGSQRLQLAAGAPRRTLRNLFQEHGVVPWMRPCLPLLFIGESVAAVADLWIDAAFQSRDAGGNVLEWLDHPAIF